MPYEKTFDGLDHFTIGDMDIWSNGIQFFMQNGAALSEEPYMTTLEDYRITIRFQASNESSAFQTNDFTLPTDIVNSILSNWNQVAINLLEHEKLGLQFSKKLRSNNIIDASKEFVLPTSNKATQLYQIIQFISKNIQWNGEYGIYTLSTPDQAYKSKDTDIAGVQYAGLALLRHYGFVADPVLLSTRSNGSMITDVPFLGQFNYVILQVYFEDQILLIDMSAPFLPQGLVPIDALNKKGFILKKEKPEWIKIDLPLFKDIHTIQAEIREDASISAKMESILRGYNASSDRKEILNSDVQKIWTDRLPPNAQITEITSEHLTDIREPLRTQIKFDLADAGVSEGERIYFSPVFYSDFTQNPFALPKRAFPIDFPYPFEEKSLYIYTIPAGYEIESLPENKKIELIDGDAFFQFLARELDGNIRIMMIIRVKETIFSTNRYGELRGLFETAAQKIKEKIVLKKTE